MFRSFLFVAAGIILIFSGGCHTLVSPGRDSRPPVQPKAEREFRAAWIATVANINWPSKPGLTTSTQQAEAVKLLDMLQDHHFNAVIFQVRPQCDAFYPSELEPWSYYLTGKQGEAPEPYYDPLAFWIEEAHRRGLEFHVWLNPYRAHHLSGGEVSENSIVKRRPELAVRLKNGMWWLDPGKEGTRSHSTRVVLDIVRRYDIDGVHFDDYFYPYPSYNDNDDFPDEETYQAYRQQGSKLSHGDWRRENVNVFIEDLYGKIKKEKPYVKFGLSPFGIWRPFYPPSISGFDQYEELYADARLWLNKGWIDYFTPQLYWPVNQIAQSYPVLLGWWVSENKRGRHLWPGMNIGRGSGKEVIDETLNQIMISRGFLKDHSGHVHWSIGPLMKNPGLLEALSTGPYRKNALVPESPWLDKKPPSPPFIRIASTGDSLDLSWEHQRTADIFRWVLYYKYGETWDYTIFNRSEKTTRLPSFLFNRQAMDQDLKEPVGDVNRMLIPVSAILLTAVDRTGNESAMTDAEIEDISGIDPPDPEYLRRLYARRLAAEQTTGREGILKTGIEVLLSENLHLIKGKRVGLITNPSAVDNDLRSDVDLMMEHPGINLVALFGAEHGIRGARQGKISGEGEPDPDTGIPVYSLYGDSYAPAGEWLEKIDVMIFDIQGVGAAWYTFKYSLSFAMEACARENVPFIVLDRPNPLGGVVVEGPLLNPGGMFRHPLPLRHGMTYGELAFMWNETERIGADLTVIKMEGWEREDMWVETGRPWIMPSPNMGTFQTALVYPGQCLFERTNISEGRGTTKPFLMTGAPWVDGRQAARDLNSRQIPGALFRPVYFIPETVEKGGNPRNKPWNRMCSGVEILVTDPEKFRPVGTSLHILDAYRKTNPDSLSWNPPETIRQLEKPGMTVGMVVDECQQEIRDFLAVRKKYILY
ncbi:MAG: DUF1343 domain-containing protein [Cyclobacteriaceae bacterium]|nr:DUF1343 domain-containing protein [Cyclobacteriaceae bacterium]